MNTKKKLTPRQMMALELLLQGCFVGEIAKEIGVSRQTVSQWKNQDPDFKEQLAHLTDELAKDLRTSAPLRESHAWSQLCKLAADGPAEVRLKASLAILDRCTQQHGEAQRSAKSDSEELLIRLMQRRHDEANDITPHTSERRQ